MKNESPLLYIIHADPIELQKPRLSRGHLYYAQQHLHKKVQESLQEQHRSFPFLVGPLTMESIFFLPLSIHQKRHGPQDLHSVSPSLAGLIRTVLSAGTGILYKSECSVVHVVATKRYDIQPRIEFYLKELNEEKI